MGPAHGSPCRCGSTEQRQLGQPDATSARNGRLVEICRYARTPTDARVVAPQFIDEGIAFTAILHAATSSTDTAVTTGPDATVTPAAQAILDALGATPATINDLAERTGKAAPALRKTLRALRDAGRVEQIGGPGRATTYWRQP
ncbi:helix-turn-helix domain-containing protein [Xylanimonas ulmi]|uniref:DprA-like winged helix domain-containing protein n=1 Tax=Xylanimonas ulmi TaxID=228973 RepID=UPI00102AAF80